MSEHGIPFAKVLELVKADQELADAIDAAINKVTERRFISNGAVLLTLEMVIMGVLADNPLVSNRAGIVEFMADKMRRDLADLNLVC